MKKNNRSSLFLIHWTPKLASFCFYLLIVLLSFDNAQGNEREAKIFRGSSEKPVPTFMPLDYYAGRASAWLDALQKVYPFIPASARNRLWDMDCDTEIGRLALASLLFPVEAATPDISSSKNIEVFLEEVEAPVSKATQILDDLDLFFLQLSLIADMRDILKKIQDLRPQKMIGMESLTTGLDPLGNSLEVIWNISRALQKGESVEEVLDKGISEKGEFLLGMIRAAEKRIEVQENQAALAIVEDALLQLEQTNRDKEVEILKKYLQSRLIHIRGLAHWHQNQLALAEKDLARALNLLDEIDLPLKLRGEIYQDLGALRQVRRDITGMCSAYRAACALGLCASLAASRRQGFCREDLHP